jgi:hypothetical protein
MLMASTLAARIPTVPIDIHDIPVRLGALEARTCEERISQSKEGCDAVRSLETENGNNRRHLVRDGGSQHPRKP